MEEEISLIIKPATSELSDGVKTMASTQEKASTQICCRHGFTSPRKQQQPDDLQRQQHNSQGICMYKASTHSHSSNKRKRIETATNGAITVGASELDEREIDERMVHQKRVGEDLKKRIQNVRERSRKSESWIIRQEQQQQQQQQQQFQGLRNDHCRFCWPGAQAQADAEDERSLDDLQEPILVCDDGKKTMPCGCDAIPGQDVGDRDESSAHFSMSENKLRKFLRLSHEKVKELHQAKEKISRLETANASVKAELGAAREELKELEHTRNKLTMALEQSRRDEKIIENLQEKMKEFEAMKLSLKESQEELEALRNKLDLARENEGQFMALKEAVGAVMTMLEEDVDKDQDQEEHMKVEIEIKEETF